MHILVTGGTGFIGGALLPELLSRGYRMTVLTRGSYSDSAAVRYVNALNAVEGKVDAVINLAGAGLAARRWSKSYKREIVDSRVGLTQHLVAWLERQQSSPQLLISGSAVGFYGQSLTQVFTEDSGPGERCRRC
jgi:NAD dependent epimerase/dehydratase family enzyme